MDPRKTGRDHFKRDYSRAYQKGPTAGTQSCLTDEPQRFLCGMRQGGVHSGSYYPSKAGWWCLQRSWAIWNDLRNAFP